MELRVSSGDPSFLGAGDGFWAGKLAIKAMECLVRYVHLRVLSPTILSVQ